jgi:uncharacterized protein (DUF433 family)
MAHPITIIDRDRGRGLQSTSRITVQDLVPYFQDNCSDAEIIRWIPVLTAEEIGVVRQYYFDHRADLDEQDRRIRERSAQRQNPPEIEAVLQRGAEKMAALREEFARKREPSERSRPADTFDNGVTCPDV